MDAEKMGAIFEAVKVLTLRPSDIVIFRAEDGRRLTMEERLTCRDWLERELGAPRIMILDGGADLAIVRPEPDPVDPNPPAPDPVPVHRPIASRGTAPGAIS